MDAVPPMGNSETQAGLTLCVDAGKEAEKTVSVRSDGRLVRTAAEHSLPLAAWLPPRTRSRMASYSFLTLRAGVKQVLQVLLPHLLLAAAAHALLKRMNPCSRDPGTAGSDAGLAENG